MRYLNQERLACASFREFRTRAPYPWMDLENSLTAEGFERLYSALPAVERFAREVGVKGERGEAPHDGYLLHYRPGMGLAECWRNFLEELEGPEYAAFLARMLATQKFLLTFEWQYAWAGCAMTPHCDAPRKLATHIFRFNTGQDWNPDWGGEFLILDGGNRLRTYASPGFDDLRVAASVDPRGNGSLLLQRTSRSWHGVRALDSPPGRLHKQFVVTVNIPSAQVRWRRMRGLDPDGYPLMPRRAA